MLRLQRPEPSLESLKAIAASRSSGLSAKAQTEVSKRKHDQLRAEMRAELAKRGGR